MRNNGNNTGEPPPGSRPQNPDPGTKRDATSDTPPPLPEEATENPPPPLKNLWAVGLLYNRTEPVTETTMLMGFSFKSDQLDAIQEVKARFADQTVGWYLLMWNAARAPVDFK